MAKFYWTTDGLEKIKQSKITSMKIGKKVNRCDDTGKPMIEYLVIPIINGKEHDKAIADGMLSEKEAHAWINQNFK